MKKLGFMLLLLMAIVTNVNANAQYLLNQTYAKFPVYTNERVNYSWNNGQSFQGTMYKVDGVVQSYFGIYKWPDGSYYNGYLNSRLQLHGAGSYYSASEKKGYNVEHNNGQLVRKTAVQPVYTGGGYTGGGYTGGGGYSGGSSSSSSSKATCRGCNGSGLCQHCHGTGRSSSGKSSCSLCHGRGRCVSCGGRGWIRM